MVCFAADQSACSTSIWALQEYEYTQQIKAVKNKKKQREEGKRISRVWGSYDGSGMVTSERSNTVE